MLIFHIFKLKLKLFRTHAIFFSSIQQHTLTYLLYSSSYYIVQGRPLFYLNIHTHAFLHTPLLTNTPQLHTFTFSPRLYPLMHPLLTHTHYLSLPFIYFFCFVFLVYLSIYVTYSGSLLSTYFFSYLFLHLFHFHEHVHALTYIVVYVYILNYFTLGLCNFLFFIPQATRLPNPLTLFLLVTFFFLFTYRFT